MPASTRTSTITTSTATTFASVSSFLPPRAEQRIHIWLSEISMPSSETRDYPSASSTLSPYLEVCTQQTLNHGRVSVAQIYATKEKGPSLKERLKRLGRMGRKDKVFGFEGERVGGDVRGSGKERTEMYGVDVPEMVGRASLVMEDEEAREREEQDREEILRNVRGLWGENGVVRLNGSDFGAGLVGQRRLDRERVQSGHEKRYSDLY